MPGLCHSLSSKATALQLQLASPQVCSAASDIQSCHRLPAHMERAEVRSGTHARSVRNQSCCVKLLLLWVQASRAKQSCRLPGASLQLLSRNVPWPSIEVSPEYPTASPGSPIYAMHRLHQPHKGFAATRSPLLSSG